MPNISVEKLIQVPIEKQKIEMVERKGLGHPDSLADGIAEAMSRALSKEYIRRFGTILHHNTDKTQIAAGKSNPRFGGGELVQPIFVLLVGRATKSFEGETIPTDRIALKAAKDYVRNVMSNLNPDVDMIFDVRIGEGSTDLKDVFRRKKGEVPLANDTSIGIGYAPLSETEKVVLNVEKRIYNEFRKNEKAVGEDVKVMGLREGNKITLTIAAALVDRYVNNLKEYDSIKIDLASFAKEVAREYTGREVEVFVNTADNYETGCIYLTVTGTSAEHGDDGSVGRGNRANGLITPCRPMSLEASSGKNPVNHVGKIYNVLAEMIAGRCYEEVSGIEEIYVKVLSQIGRPINDPKVLSLKILPKSGVDFDLISLKARKIAEEMVGEITKITDLIIEGKISTF
ncbi:MAG: methionine adenosyltransferase [Archaeoglobaceae archaeon]|nr:methionine adenosyltransferase [Archaeoglobaceae archaeon]MCX8152246.1 methionine adenosyltransferase [Archaeoglobaceae archaeon]MDW8013924.1 methionine adenosyltransferase [Archaeoglobaceae archaeon]